MNEQQRLYLVQAQSDWRLYDLLKLEKKCHRLHYLQMCTEKLAKAFFWKSATAANLEHAAFVRFLRANATNRKLAEKLGFTTARSFGEWIKDVSELAYAIERLAPALAGAGPNPEYPWPREKPLHTPVEHTFDVWEHWQARPGHGLFRLLSIALTEFDQCF